MPTQLERRRRERVVKVDLNMVLRKKSAETKDV
jgi:hypothetical protein